jgi:hypothetical protein
VLLSRNPSIGGSKNFQTIFALTRQAKHLHHDLQVLRLEVGWLMVEKLNRMTLAYDQAGPETKPNQARTRPSSP